MAAELDAIDAKILDLIQRDAALSVAEIAEKVGLSSSPCWRRIKRMEEQGIIARRVTLLNYDKLGSELRSCGQRQTATPQPRKPREVRTGRPQMARSASSA